MLRQVRGLVGGDRFENLYRAVRDELQRLTPSPRSLLDFGCGAMDFSLRLRGEDVIGQFVAMDVFPPPANPDSRWSHYRQLHDGTFPSNAERFDAAIVIDVLHHVDERTRSSLLRSLGDAVRFVVVKDHFEFGVFSRQMLRLADWFGNYAYGVRIPSRYFTPTRWDALISAAGLREIRRVQNVRVHDGLFGVLLPSRHHFISVLTRDARDAGEPS
jgi:hypothetical protein